MLKITNNQELSSFNTFRMRSRCNTFVEFDSVADFFELDFEELPKPIIALGGGSNVLFTKNFDGTILFSKIDFIEVIEEESTSSSESLPFAADKVLVSVGSGVELDSLCQWAAQQGYWGLENLSYIPGKVGASAVQNVGAYGVEAKDVIKTVCCFDIEEEEFFKVDAKDCDFDYRYSAFKHPEIKGRYIITHIIFELSKTPSPKLDYGHLKERVESEGAELTPMLIREVVTAIRKEKLPEVREVGSVGSYFTNPIITPEEFKKVEKVVLEDAKTDALHLETQVPHYLINHEGIDLVKLSAAWLIDYCGWKGYAEGNVAVYEKQPLVLINATGKARAAEILELEEKIVSSIKEKFGVELEPEVEKI